MDPIKEEVQYIKDTPIRIIHDSEISMFRGRLQPHWHEEIEIDCVLNGNVNYIINGTNYKVSQGEIVVVDSNIIHSGCCSEGTTLEETRAEVLTIQINKSVLNYANYEIPAFQEHINSAEGQEMKSIMLEMMNNYERKPPYYEMLINSLCLKLCYCLLSRHSSDRSGFGPSGKVNDSLKLALQYIENHCTEELKLEDITELTGYNTSYFSRIFHQYTGFTFVEYLNRCRANTAARYLMESDKSISDIAMDSGFPNVSYFITFFKREFKTTPERYRRLNKH